METFTFRSRVDAWLVAVTLGVPVAVLAFVLWRFPPQGSAHAVVAAAVLIPLGLPLWLLASTRYQLSDDTLRIASGPFRWTVPIAEIQAIRPTRNPLSSPALSLQRLEIRYGPGRTVLISPADQDGFLRALETRRPPLPASGSAGRGQAAG
ncbi:MAG: PH domain-containing protein [Deltaproteobacteria bacterium]|nr:PH domain-containing protein [Deltaproteobacteria bacterium]